MCAFQSPVRFQRWNCTRRFGIYPFLDACCSIVGKFPTMELYVAFWGVPILGCVPMVFGKLLSLGCWSYLLICQEIFELIPVLYFPVE